eukprot:tig00020816_g14194.t1
MRRTAGSSARAALLLAVGLLLAVLVTRVHAGALFGVANVRGESKWVLINRYTGDVIPIVALPELTAMILGTASFSADQHMLRTVQSRPENFALSRVTSSDTWNEGGSSTPPEFPYAVSSFEIASTGKLYGVAYNQDDIILVEVDPTTGAYREYVRYNGALMASLTPTPRPNLSLKYVKPGLSAFDVNTGRYFSILVDASSFDAVSNSYPSYLVTTDIKSNITAVSTSVVTPSISMLKFDEVTGNLFAQIVNGTNQVVYLDLNTGVPSFWANIDDEYSGLYVQAVDPTDPVSGKPLFLTTSIQTGAGLGRERIKGIGLQPATRNITTDIPLTFDGSLSFLHATTDDLIWKMTPRTGPSTGATVLSMYGSQLPIVTTQLSGIKVWFNITGYPGIPVDGALVPSSPNRFVQCNTPSIGFMYRLGKTLSDVSIALDGVSRYPLLFNFTFYAAPVVLVRANIYVGSVLGGNRVTLFGYNFTETGEIQVGFPPPGRGYTFNSTSPGIYTGLDMLGLNFLTIFVYAPPSPTGRNGSYPLDVALNGQQYTLSGLTWQYYNLPVYITRVIPGSGLNSGNTRILILGVGLVRTVNTTCRFGTFGSPADDTKVSQGTFDDATGGVICVTPSVSDRTFTTAISSVQLSLDTQIYNNSLPFIFFRDPTTVSFMKPRSGPNTGETFISVTGQNFLPTVFTESVCRFGELGLANATVVCPASNPQCESTTLTCTSPPVDAPPAPNPFPVFFDVSLNNQQFSNAATQPFLFYQTPVRTTGFIPSFGPANGGVSITAQGFNFVETEEIIVNLGPPSNYTDTLLNSTGVVFLDNTVNAYSVLFTLPARIYAGFVTGEVGLNGQQFTTDGKLFYYLPVVTSVFPDSGMYWEGDREPEPLRITVRGFGFVNTPQLTCRWRSTMENNMAIDDGRFERKVWGPDYVTWVSPTEIICRAPMFPASEVRLSSVNTTLEVSVDDVYFSVNRIRYEVLGNVTGGGAGPNLGYNTGGTVVTVSGSNFRQSAQGKACRWRLCRTLDDCSNVYDLATVTTFIQDDRRTPVFVLSNDRLTCVSPNIADVRNGTVRAKLDVSMNSVFWSSEPADVMVDYFFYPEPTLGTVTPNVGTGDGGNNISMSGTNLLDVESWKGSSLDFLVGNYTNNVEIVGDNGIARTRWTPENNVSCRWIDYQTEFGIEDPPGAVPNMRYLVDGNMRKRPDGSLYITCITPKFDVPNPDAPGPFRKRYYTLKLQISYNRQQFTTQNPNFIVYPNVTNVVYINPSAGLTAGNTVVNITGRGYIPTDYLTCRWSIGNEDRGQILGIIRVGDRFTPATYSPENRGLGTDYATLICPSPVLPDEMTSRQVVVEVSLDGQFYTQSRKLYQYVDKRINISSISPRSGPNGFAFDIDRTTVTVYSNLRPDGLAGYYTPSGSAVNPLVRPYCRFDTMLVPATVIDDLTIQCTSAPVKVQGLVSFEISLNGIEFTNSGQTFLFYDPFFEVLAIDPRSGPTGGGTNVTITGTRFVNTGEAYCVWPAIFPDPEFDIPDPDTVLPPTEYLDFGALTPAIVVNNYTITCTSPQSGGSLESAMGVSLNGQQTVYGEAIWQYFDGPIMVSRISPTVLTVDGTNLNDTSGTALTVYGNRFVDTGEVKCKFGPRVTFNEFDESTYVPGPGLAITEATVTQILDISGNQVDAVISCNVPPLPVGDWAVEVGLNGQQFSMNGVPLNIYDPRQPPVIRSIDPFSIPRNIPDVPIRISGSNFGALDTLTVWFRDPIWKVDPNTPKMLNLKRAVSAICSPVTGNVPCTHFMHGELVLSYAPTWDQILMIYLLVSNDPGSNNTLYSAEVDGARLWYSAMDPSKCIATGSGLVGSVAGEPYELQIIAYDVNGRRIEKGGDDFRWALDGFARYRGTLANGGVVDNNDGSYYVRSTSITRAGNYTLSITAGGMHIKSSPWRPVIIEPAATAPLECLISTTDLRTLTVARGIVAGRQTPYEIQVRDRFRNIRRAQQPGHPKYDYFTIFFQDATTVDIDFPQPRSPAGPTIERRPATSILPGPFGPVVVTLNPNTLQTALGMKAGDIFEQRTVGNKYLVHYNITRAGRYVMNVQFGNATMDRITIQNGRVSMLVIPDELHPPSCTARGTLLTNRPNPTNPKFISVSDSQDVDPTFDNLKRSVAGALSFYVVEFRDRFGNIKTDTRYADTALQRTIVGTPDRPGLIATNMTARDSGSQRFIRNDFYNFNQGLGLYSYTITRSGQYRLTAAVRGTPVIGSPFLIDVLPAPTDPLWSTITGEDRVDVGIIQSTAGEWSNFTIEARDRFGNLRLTRGDNFYIFIQPLNPSTPIPVPSQHVFDIDRDPQFPELGAPFEITDTGLYRFRFRLSRAGTYVLNITGRVSGAGPFLPVGNNTELLDDGETPTSTTYNGVYTILVNPAPADARACIAYGTGLTSGVASFNSLFTIRSRDRFGNNRTAGGDVFVITAELITRVAGRDVPGFNNTDIFITDNLDGTYGVRYQFMKAGVYILRAWLVDANGNAPVNGLPVIEYLEAVTSTFTSIYSPNVGIRDFRINIQRAPAPQMLSATLDELGKQVVVEFDFDTNRGIYDGRYLEGLFSCAYMFKDVSFLGGPTDATESKCSWISNKRLVISLGFIGEDADPPVNRELTTRDDNRFSIMTFFENSFTSNSTIRIRARFLPQVTVVLVGPIVAGQCDVITYDGGDSRGSGPFAWRKWEWQILAGDNTTATLIKASVFYTRQMQNLTAMLRGVNARRITILPQQLPTHDSIPMNFLVRLNLTNKFNQSSDFVPIPLSKINQDFPVVYIRGAKNVTTLRPQQVNVVARANLSACLNDLRTLDFNWTLMSPNRPDVTRQIKSLSKSNLLIEKNILSPFTTYRFRVQVSYRVPGAPTPFVSPSYDEVLIKVDPSPLVPIVLGGNRPIFMGDAFVLDAGSSYDPDNTTDTRFLYTWNCKDVQFNVDESKAQYCKINENGKRVDFAPRTSRVLEIRRFQFAVGTYRFYLNVTKVDPDGTARSSFTTTDIDIVGTKPLIVQIKPFPNPNKVNPAQRFQLEGLVQDYESNVVAFHWTVRQGDLNLTDPTVLATQSPDLFNLVTNAYSLTQGQTYRLRLTATHKGIPGLTGYAEATFTVNDVPSGGTVSYFIDGQAVSRGNITGMALASTFRVDCASWTDSDTPLIYGYAFNYDNTGDITTDTFLSQTTRSSLEFSLPQGDETNGFRIYIIVYIIDSYGAYSRVAVPATVTPPVITTTRVDFVRERITKNLDIQIATGSVEASVSYIVQLRAVLQNDTVVAATKQSTAAGRLFSGARYQARMPLSLEARPKPPGPGPLPNGNVATIPRAPRRNLFQAATNATETLDMAVVRTLELLIEYLKKATDRGEPTTFNAAHTLDALQGLMTDKNTVFMFNLTTFATAITLANDTFIVTVSSDGVVAASVSINAAQVLDSVAYGVLGTPVNQQSASQAARSTIGSQGQRRRALSDADAGPRFGRRGLLQVNATGNGTSFGSVPLDDPVQMAAQQSVADKVRSMLSFVVKTSIQGLVCGENPIAFAPGAYTTFSAAGFRDCARSYGLPDNPKSVCEGVSNVAGESRAYEIPDTKGGVMRITIPYSVWCKAASAPVGSALDIVTVTFNQNPYQYTQTTRDLGLDRFGTDVVGIEVFVNRDTLDVQRMQVPIEIKVPTRLLTVNPSLEPTCRFWNETMGTWSGAGCVVGDVNDNFTTCYCTHLTEFGVVYTPTRPQLNAPSVRPLVNPFAIRGTIGNYTTVVVVSFLLLVFVVASALGHRKDRKSLLEWRDKRAYDEPYLYQRPGEPVWTAVLPNIVPALRTYKELAAAALRARAKAALEGGEEEVDPKAAAKGIAKLFQKSDKVIDGKSMKDGGKSLAADAAAGKAPKSLAFQNVLEANPFEDEEDEQAKKARLEKEAAMPRWRRRGRELLRAVVEAHPVTGIINTRPGDPFSRPQRIACLTVTVMGILALQSVFYGVGFGEAIRVSPGVLPDTYWMLLGVIVAAVLAPVHWGFMLAFKRAHVFVVKIGTRESRQIEDEFSLLDLKRGKLPSTAEPAEVAKRVTRAQAVFKGYLTRKRYRVSRAIDLSYTLPTRRLRPAPSLAAAIRDQRAGQQEDGAAMPGAIGQRSPLPRQGPRPPPGPPPPAKIVAARLALGTRAPSLSSSLGSPGGGRRGPMPPDAGDEPWRPAGARRPRRPRPRARPRAPPAPPSPPPSAPRRAPPAPGLPPVVNGQPRVGPRPPPAPAGDPAMAGIPRRPRVVQDGSGRGQLVPSATGRQGPRPPSGEGDAGRGLYNARRRMLARSLGSPQGPSTPMGARSPPPPLGPPPAFASVRANLAAAAAGAASPKFGSPGGFVGLPGAGSPKVAPPPRAGMAGVALSKSGSGTIRVPSQVDYLVTRVQALYRGFITRKHLRLSKFMTPATDKGLPTHVWYAGERDVDYADKLAARTRKDASVESQWKRVYDTIRPLVLPAFYTPPPVAASAPLKETIIRMVNDADSGSYYTVADSPNAATPVPRNFILLPFTIAFLWVGFTGYIAVVMGFAFDDSMAWSWVGSVLWSLAQYMVLQEPARILMLRAWRASMAEAERIGHEAAEKERLKKKRAAADFSREMKPVKEAPVADVETMGGKGKPPGKSQVAPAPPEAPPEASPASPTEGKMLFTRTLPRVPMFDEPPPPPPPPDAPTPADDATPTPTPAPPPAPGSISSTGSASCAPLQPPPPPGPPPEGLAGIRRKPPPPPGPPPAVPVARPSTGTRPGSSAAQRPASRERPSSRGPLPPAQFLAEEGEFPPLDGGAPTPTPGDPAADFADSGDDGDGAREPPAPRAQPQPQPQPQPAADPEPTPRAFDAGRVALPTSAGGLEGRRRPRPATWRWRTWRTRSTPAAPRSPALTRGGGRGDAREPAAEAAAEPEPAAPGGDGGGTFPALDLSSAAAAREAAPPPPEAESARDPGPPRTRWTACEAPAPAPAPAALPPTLGPTPAPPHPFTCAVRLDS